MFRRSDLALLLLPLLVACTAKPSGNDDSGPNPDRDGGTTTEDGGMNPADGGIPFAESEKSNLRFKEVLRLTNDFAQALDLPAEDVCKELGQYDCRGVHNIALGGVEPYELGLVEPTPSTTITTPMAVERLAIHACERRVTMDLSSGTPLIFSADRAQSIDTLYKRALLRPAKPSEVEHLEGLFTDVQGLGVGEPERQWAIASCVAVLTSVEALFY